MAQQRDRKMDALIGEMLAVNSMLNELKVEKDRISGELKSYMELNGIEEYASCVGRATYREVVSHLVDTRQLKAELPIIAERYSFDRHAMQLRVS